MIEARKSEVATLGDDPQLAGFRAGVKRLTIQQIKSRLMDVQQKINGTDVSKASAEERPLVLALMEQLLRRFSILQGELVRRGFHTKADSGDLSRWLEQGAKVRRSF